MNKKDNIQQRIDEAMSSMDDAATCNAPTFFINQDNGKNECSKRNLLGKKQAGSSAAPHLP